MAKILVGKNDELEDVLSAIKNNAGNDVVLVIPKGARLKEVAGNFPVIRGEATTAQKHVSVESVDEDILALAEAAELEATHPLFAGNRTGAPKLSDIVAGKPREIKKTARGKKAAVRVEKEVVVEAVRPSDHEPLPAAPPRVLEPIIPAPTVVPATPSERTMETIVRETVSADLPVRRRWISRRIGIIGAVLLVVILGGFWVAGRMLGRADIVITFAKTPWEHTATILADKAVSAVNSANSVIPGEVFTQEKNFTKLFPASGRKQVSEKAHGTITIYNAYSSQAQQLVATTRFETPDGKIFRLDKTVTVPGAKVQSGTITPASIEAAVTADKAGETYNIGPIERLTIPGFKGSPKYAGFYGDLKAPASGGFIGEKAVPTAADIASAKESVSETLRSSLSTDVLQRLPEDFEIIEGASAISVTRLTANETTDASGNFAVFGRAELKAVGFKESHLTELLKTIMNADHDGKVFREITLGYTGVLNDFVKGTVRFSVAATAVLTPAFDADAFEEKVLGKRIRDVRPMLAGLTELTDAEVSLWPSWVLRVPKNPARVHITVE